MDAIDSTHRHVTDRMDPARATALWQVLGPDLFAAGAPPVPGTPLPPFFHQVYFWNVAPHDALGDDGHEALGRVIPDLGLPRRMWAGGRLQFHAALHSGIGAEKQSSIHSVMRKDGRSGRLAFVTMRHSIFQRGALVISEDQEIVYRELPGEGEEAVTPATISDRAHDTVPVIFDARRLFRYSALTMNAHRIHYDAAFCAEQGFGGLVVHGPLLAQALMLMAADRLGPLASFAFRATAALHAGEPAEFCADGTRFWVRGPEGRLCMTATAEAA